MKRSLSGLLWGGYAPVRSQASTCAATLHCRELSPFCHRCLPPAGKPAAIVEKMVGGRLNKFYEEWCLLEQKYILDDSLKVGRWGGGLIGAPAWLPSLPSPCLTGRPTGCERCWGRGRECEGV